MRKSMGWSSAFLLGVLVPAVSFAELSHAQDAAVVFTAAGPAGMKIEGKTSDLGVSEKDGSVTVVVPLANLDTGISLRNKHMREKYLEVQKYPRAELVVARTELKLPAGGAEVRGTAGGQMTIHGQTRPVTLQYTARLANGRYEVQGTTRIDIKEFGIDVPSYLGVTVKPGVDLSASFSVADR